MIRLEIFLPKGDYIGGEKEGEWIYQVGDHQERGSYVIGLERRDLEILLSPMEN